ncbi:MAG: hypothetical protein JRK53_06775 [Deltaproteobacteria bacterium]|nr:hypothetical protein [Deltaproteobacteria bacterium]
MRGRLGGVRGRLGGVRGRLGGCGDGWGAAGRRSRRLLAGEDKRGRGSEILPFFGVLVLSEAVLVVVVVVVIEEIVQFGHEQLDVLSGCTRIRRQEALGALRRLRQRQRIALTLATFAFFAREKRPEVRGRKSEGRGQRAEGRKNNVN